jgi:hypothetical protein
MRMIRTRRKRAQPSRARCVSTMPRSLYFGTEEWRDIDKRRTASKLGYTHIANGDRAVRNSADLEICKLIFVSKHKLGAPALGLRQQGRTFRPDGIPHFLIGVPGLDGAELTHRLSRGAQMSKTARVSRTSETRSRIAA